MEINQYQIVLVGLDPTKGREISKTRPCVVLSPNEMNHFFGTVVVAPMTTTLKPFPSRILVFHDGKKGMIALDQIRAVDKSRIIKSFEFLSELEIKKVKELIKETFVD
jgi:mRNA interferase MazF